MATAKLKSVQKKATVKKQSKIKEVKLAISKNSTKTIFRPDIKQTAALIKAGRIGSANAIRASKALGLSIAYMRKGIMYMESPEGIKEVIATFKPIDKKLNIQLKKGMIFHEKNKGLR